MTKPQTTITMPLLALFVSLVLIVFMAEEGLHKVVANPISQTVPIHTTSLYTLSNISILSADSFVADVHLGFNVVLTKQAIRLRNFEAWGTNDKRGVNAKEFVTRLLATSQFKITDGAHDMSNRIVTDVYWLNTKQQPMIYAPLAELLRIQGYERRNENDGQLENKD